MLRCRATFVRSARTCPSFLARTLSAQTNLPKDSSVLISPADTIENVSTKETLLKVASISRPEMKLIGAAAATLGVTSSVTLLLPFVSGRVIDSAILAASNPTVAEFSTAPVALGLFGLTAVAGGGVYTRSLLLTTAGNRIVSRLRRRLFASAVAQDAAYFDATPTGDILSRLSADAQLVQAAVTTQAVSALRGSVMSTGAAAMLFQTSASLAFVSMSTLPPVLLAARHFGRTLRKRQAEVQALHAEATVTAEEVISGIKTVKQFGAERHELGRFSSAVENAHDEAIRSGKLQAAFDGAVHVAANGAVLCVLGYGGGMVLSGDITAGDLTGFLMYSLLMAGNISSLSSTYADMMKSVAAAGRVFSVIERVPMIPSTLCHEEETSTKDITTDLAGTKATQYAPLHSRKLPIEFQNLTFAYPTRPDAAVIGPKFSLKIRAGEVMALVGGSGSGKSTIAALLTRLYDISPSEDGTTSAILIDGHDIRDLDPSTLRECVGIVSQEPLLFSTTIEENIRYGKLSASDEEVREAARVAHVLEFAENFPEGLQTCVGSRGTQLSGGQRQRVAVARIILKDPRIVVFDEATSALDAESEFHVKHAIGTVMKDRTVISIAHRLSTIRDSDRVAVLKSGKIAEMGTFDELARRDNGAFQELMGRQLVLDE